MRAFECLSLKPLKTLGFSNVVIFLAITSQIHMLMTALKANSNDSFLNTDSQRKKFFLFIKLVIKIKDEIVAYKIPDNEYNMSKTGKHLNYKNYNAAINNGAIIVDIRNYYEGEVGKFENAIIPDVDTSREPISDAEGRYVYLL